MEEIVNKEFTFTYRDRWCSSQRQPFRHQKRKHVIIGGISVLYTYISTAAPTIMKSQQNHIEKRWNLANEM